MLQYPTGAIHWSWRRDEALLAPLRLVVAGMRSLGAGCPISEMFAAGGFLVPPHPTSPRVPACSPPFPSPQASLIYLFLHAELSELNPEPQASSGRGGRGGEQQGLKSEVLQPSWEATAPKM